MTTQGLAAFVAREVRAELARQRVMQRQAAEWLGISQPQFGLRLNGEIEFRPSELDRLAEGLGVPVTTFLPSPVTSVTAVTSAA
jgi:predicted XRE-type DNA-binding protein